MIKVVNNVLNIEDCFALYSALIGSNIWKLNEGSFLDKQRGCFPRATFIHDGKIALNDQYWIGYFNCLFDRINSKLKEQHNFSMNRVIKRIALNAQNDNHYTEFHSDSLGSDYSIVGFLTPQWSEDWGGELNIEGETIKYNPGDFVIFEGAKLHKSQPIKKIPYWRLSINYVIEKK